jgi:hypothetical protein
MPGPLGGAVTREVSVKGERGKLYDSAAAFFELEGNVVMFLTPDAASQVCRACTTRDELVFRVEGGIWREPGFEARLDCIWDGLEPPIDRVSAERNNQAAAEFIQNQSVAHTAFVVSTTSIRGWEHRGV